MSEAGIAPKIVSTKKQFAAETAKPKVPTRNLGWLGDLDDIIKPTSDTVGIRSVGIQWCCPHMKAVEADGLEGRTRSR